MFQTIRYINIIILKSKPITILKYINIHNIYIISKYIYSLILDILIKLLYYHSVFLYENHNYRLSNDMTNMYFCSMVLWFLDVLWLDMTRLFIVSSISFLSLILLLLLCLWLLQIPNYILAQILSHYLGW